MNATKIFTEPDLSDIGKYDTGKPGEIERLMPGLGRERPEKCFSNSNSLALYSTARPVRRGEAGK